MDLENSLCQSFRQATQHSSTFVRVRNQIDTNRNKNRSESNPQRKGSYTLAISIIGWRSHAVARQKPALIRMQRATDARRRGLADNCAFWPRTAVAYTKFELFLNELFSRVYVYRAFCSRIMILWSGSCEVTMGSYVAWRTWGLTADKVESILEKQVVTGWCSLDWNDLVKGLGKLFKWKSIQFMYQLVLIFRFIWWRSLVD